MKELVKTTVEKYGSRDPFEILEAIGAIVYFQPIGETRGFTFWNDETPLVCLSDALSAPERLRVAAHELGHVIMHRHINAFRDDPQRVEEAERDADLFAELLIGEEARIYEH
ncbi:MAG: ImmA/IrrE family metallo-endopeptidase [Clostridiales bacterium]|nr:ImmA/IrrE family metallo-endopeptidase [Clostridiales bacterium]